METALLAAVLRSCESLMAYRRGYSSPPEIVPTLALLLLNETNPRALVFQLASLERHLAALPRDDAGLQLSEEARSVLEAATTVRLSDLATLASVEPDGKLRGALDQLLVRVEYLLRNTSEALGRDYFVDARGPQQLIGTEPTP
ncbi:MAG: alpha-E domain-containing protein [Gammaproteobacteria bacterium]